MFSFIKLFIIEKKYIFCKKKLLTCIVDCSKHKCTSVSRASVCN